MPQRTNLQVRPTAPAFAVIRRASSRVKVAPANNLLAEISKASSGTVCHIAGKWFLHSYTAAHELVCKCKAGSLSITQDLRSSDVYRLRASSSRQPQVWQGAGLFNGEQKARATLRYFAAICRALSLLSNFAAESSARFILNAIA